MRVPLCWKCLGYSSKPSPMCMAVVHDIIYVWRRVSSLSLDLRLMVTIVSGMKGYFHIDVEFIISELRLHSTTTNDYHLRDFVLCSLCNSPRFSQVSDARSGYQHGCLIHSLFCAARYVATCAPFLALTFSATIPCKLVLSF